MPRICGWCSHPQRTEWESDLAKGTPVSVVATATPYSESAARRHVRLHVRPELLTQMRGLGSGLHLADFSSRLVELVEEASHVRAYAMATHAPKLALQAIDSERAALVTLMARLGIDSVEAAELHEESRAFVNAILTVLGSGNFPDLGEAFAVQMELAGLHDLARKMREMNTTRAEEVTQ